MSRRQQQNLDEKKERKGRMISPVLLLGGKILFCILDPASVLYSKSTAQVL
jgi:hypothetical protein